MKKSIYSKHAPEPIGPYSQAILTGNTLYVSGQIAMNPGSGDLIKNDIRLETHQVMKNIQAILRQAEMDMNAVVKCSIFIRNMDDFKNINEVYAEYFKAEPPARETIEVNRLPKDVNVEISCIAVKSDD